MMNPFSWCFRPRRLCLALVACSTFSFALQSEPSLELTRPVRSWEFLSAVGTRAGWLGNEQGTLEAWVYPLKILRNFHLRFHLDGTVVPAESLARTVIVSPEASTIVYTGEVFSVRETLFVPVHEPGAVIALSIDTTEPLEIEALFNQDFQLEWPGAIGGVDREWDPALHAFRFAEVSGKFEALVGSPSPGPIRVQVQSTGAGHCFLEFSPALSLRARMVRVRLNGRPFPSHVEANSRDQHVCVRVPLVGTRTPWKSR